MNIFQKCFSAIVAIKRSIQVRRVASAAGNFQGAISENNLISYQRPTKLGQLCKSA